jgi:uncharacterized protein
MKIKLRGLKAGEHHLEATEPVDLFELDPTIFIQPLHSDVSIDVQGKNYYIDIVTRTVTRLECDRCLVLFERAYEVKTMLIYTEDPTLDPYYTQEDVYFLPASQDAADVTDDVRQNVLLNLPMKRLCSELCKGLCSECGVNLNYEQCACIHEVIDPRWEELSKLLKKKTNVKNG